ncbi:MAG: hypothetical protein H7249_19240 [Chitinophagaceae bacterium]|nr:hypothetical protein [Oligoflexus sp.]
MKSFSSEHDQQTKINGGHKLWLKLPFILSAVLVGIVSVSFAKLSESATETFVHIIQLSHYWTLLLTPLAFVLSRFIVLKGAPAAAGSGIPQAMAALDLERTTSESAIILGKLLSVRIIGIKILSNLVCLFGGKYISHGRQ